MSSRNHPLCVNKLSLVSATSDALASNVGFVPSVSGLANVRCDGDTAYTALTVVAGIFYPFQVQGFNTTGSAASQTLALCRQAVVSITT
jgi:hypothetical protein